ncbi:alkaline phosphatase family protein [Bacteriovoracaceae bacterium]|nr:alkaline phosphatase family protein [Bacteriovoracaceae bacterium]
MKKHTTIFLLMSFTLTILKLYAEDNPRSSDFRNVKPLTILISIDGLRPDALKKAQTPYIDRLRKNAVCDKIARTVLPSLTLPSHTSMLFGVSSRKHGIWWNSYREEVGLIKINGIFDLVQIKGHRSAMIAGKEKFKHFVGIRPNGMRIPSIFHLEPDSSKFPKLFYDVVIKKQVDFVFIHFRDADSAGHKYGWMSESQMNAISRVDGAIGEIINMLIENKLRDKTSILITSDHGGTGKSHFTPISKNLNIPWILSLSEENRLSLPSNCRDRIKTYDSAATMARMMNFIVPRAWDWDGRSGI